jgi:hypothetical protein
MVQRRPCESSLPASPRATGAWKRRARAVKGPHTPRVDGQIDPAPRGPVGLDDAAVDAVGRQVGRHIQKPDPFPLVEQGAEVF